MAARIQTDDAVPVHGGSHGDEAGDHAAATDHARAGRLAPLARVSSAVIPRTALGELSILPTILPTRLANLVTVLATTARVSIRIAAFFVEAILESSEYTTRLGLGYTRRILVSAITSARRVYLAAADDADALLLGFGGDGENSGAIGKAAAATAPGLLTDRFIQTLERYTNLGIYVIHHAFTMAELFAMSGFYLTATASRTAEHAARESVDLFDSIFGSNESSRTLSAIIALVRRELLEDPRYVAARKSKVATITSLTKALTAFACLQNATWGRTSEALRMRVLHDCTVLVERDEATNSTSGVIAYNNLREGAGRPQRDAVAGPGPSTMEHRRRDSSCAIDLGSPMRPRRRTDSGGAADDLDSVWELEDYVGESGDAVYDGPPDPDGRRQRRLRRLHEDLYEITDELTESTVVTRTLERVASTVGSPSAATAPPASWGMHSRQRSAPLPDVTVEDAPELDVGSAHLARRMSESALTEDENEWIEVDQLLDDDDEGGGATIPSVPHGSLTASPSLPFRQAVEHPYANAERIQVVLRTMTNRLLQRKRMVRRVSTSRDKSSSRDASRVRGEPSLSPEVERGHGLLPPPRRGDGRRLDWRIGEEAEQGAGSGERARRDSDSSASTVTPTVKRSFAHRQSTSPDSSRKGAAFRALSSKLFPMSNKTPSPATSASASSTPSSSANPFAASPVPSPAPLHPKPAAARRSASIERGAHEPGRRRRLSHSTRHEHIRATSNRVHAASSQFLPESGDASPSNLFPHDGLVKNIHRFMRYSSAAYGQNFLRILGLGNSDFVFPSTGRHHANSWAFAQHTKIPIDAILLSSSTGSTQSLSYEKAPPLVHYITVEHKLKTIVLTCRGTLGLSDVLVDLTCDYRAIDVDGGDADGNYLVHAGMYASAVQLTAKSSTVHRTLADALGRYPTYGLVLCGHSLGGGVAALLALISSTPADIFARENGARPQPFAHPPIATPFVTSVGSGLPPGRPIHCYAYGPPAVASLDLARYARGLITSVVQNADVVPTLSLGVLRDLRNIAITLSEEGTVAEEIVGRIVGINKRKFAFQDAPLSDDRRVALAETSDEEMLSDWLVSLIKTMRADMDNDKLYPPGMVYILEHFDVYVTDTEETVGATGKKITHRQAQRVCDSVHERFREPMFSKTMLNDHLPSHYERSTQLLYEGLAHDG